MLASGNSFDKGLVRTCNDVELTRKSFRVPLDGAFIERRHYILVLIKDGTALRGIFPAVQFA